MTMRRIGLCQSNEGLFVYRIVLFVVFQQFHHAIAKSVEGTLTSAAAQRDKGQYLTAFCFSGDGGLIKYSLNTSGHAAPSLLLYVDDDWQNIVADDTITCEQKIQRASIVHLVTNTTGNHTIPSLPKPQIWHAIFADAYTCHVDTAEEQQQQEQQQEKEGEQDKQQQDEKQQDEKPVIKGDNFISFHVEMLNPDVLGNPTVHFSDDEFGLHRFYQLLTLAFFVLGCIYGPHMYDALHTEGPMTLVIQLLTSTLALHASCAFLTMMHLRSYSKDGFGAPWFMLLAELLDMVSQSLMLYMMLSLSLGRTFAGIYKPIKSFSKLQQQTAARLVTVLAVLQGLLFIWEQYEESVHRMHLTLRSYPGLFLSVTRILLAAIVAVHQYHHVLAERSAMKREFYASFTKYCVLWFLCFPALVLLSWFFSPYHRYKIVSMGVVLCQSLSVVLIYRLFHTRSLYWEVSSLGSGLPLRMDKSFTMKIYS